MGVTLKSSPHIKNGYKFMKDNLNEWTEKDFQKAKEQLNLSKDRIQEFSEKIAKINDVDDFLKIFFN